MTAVLKKTSQQGRAPYRFGIPDLLQKLFNVLLAVVLGLGIVGQSALADSADPEREKQLEQVIKERIEGDNCNVPAAYDDAPYIELIEYHAAEFGDKYSLASDRHVRYLHCYAGITDSAVFASRLFVANKHAKEDGIHSALESTSYEYVLDYFKEKTADGYSSARNDQGELIESSPIYQLEKQILDISYTPGMGALFKEDTADGGDAEIFREEIRKQLYCECMAIPAVEFN